MKRLSIRCVALATALLFFCTSFRDGHAMATISKKVATTAYDTHYFYYTDGGTVYDGWYTISDEVLRLESEYDVLVDGDPTGGTLLASGYPYYGLPHLTYPSSLLYGHF